MLTGGQLAALIVAVFWAILVCFLAVVLVRLTRVLTETSKIIADLGERTGPLLDDMSTTVARANEQMARVDTITANVEKMSGDAVAMTTAARSVFGVPLVKIAAFFHGLRRAIGARRGRPANTSGRSQTGRRQR
jgi:hypothetical protein